MAAFFVWGSAPNSFAVANGSVLHYQNMPAEYEGSFKMNDFNARQLKGFHTDPDSYHVAFKESGQCKKCFPFPNYVCCQALVRSILTSASQGRPAAHQT
ncbi:hypothetical protein F5Y16DRAFT_393418 [Xylariaceae sp. FL0255]|nr:hypothetical protein F5Y16DRAFT_393418 [Xylariaceae sp. FL0255]